MERDINEIEEIIDLSSKWYEKQWNLLSKNEKQIHSAKKLFVKETLSKYKLLKRDLKNLNNKRDVDESWHIKSHGYILLALFFLYLIFTFLFNILTFDSIFKWLAVTTIISSYIGSLSKDNQYQNKVSSISNLLHLFERDLYSLGLSYLFIHKSISHEEIYDEDNIEKYESLSSEDKRKIHLASQFMDYCISVAVLKTYCSSEDLIDPPREIDHGGVFF